MSSEVAICVEDVSKCYTIYDRPQDRLKQSIVPKLQRLWGRGDINYYKEFWALKNVSFEVMKGDTFGIVGRNGSGKSTLLQIISGTVYPSGGSVRTRGRVAALLELGSGFNLDFTGRENVHLNASLFGLDRSEINARFKAIEAFADIGGFIDQPVRTYSSGMVVRLAFAVIAHVDADILVIDEALSVGDAFFVQKCMRFLREFMRRGTILFVSHDTAAVVNLCNKAILLEAGHVRERGSPKDVVEVYLAKIYEEQQGPHAVTPSVTKGSRHRGNERDMRLDYVNATRLRNDIDVFAFDPGKPAFGKGGATITSAVLADENGMPLSWIVGGELVSLTVQAHATTDLARPIIGFIVKDRLGQHLFGDNTYLSYQDNPIPLKSGGLLEARFDFRMPILQAGEYTVTVAVADGTQRDHTQHHWIYDALKITSHSSSVATGLVGVPMIGIQLSLPETAQ